MFEKKDNNHFVVGTLVGGVLAGAAALLLASKRGCELREDISDALSEKYEQLSDALEDYTPRRLWEPEPQTNYTSLMAGGLVGGILAAAAALLTTPKSGNTLRRELSKLGEEGTDHVRELVEGLTNRRKGPLHHVRQRLRRK